MGLFTRGSGCVVLPTEVNTGATCDHVALLFSAIDNLERATVAPSVLAAPPPTGREPSTTRAAGAAVRGEVAFQLGLWETSGLRTFGTSAK